ncbi:hypothetical protein LG288_06795 [Idiomarina seosinensis]|uniref:hypothetical protein n=1 Tax=Idiomarina seosinensis TaxID=281739 RepID=UPI00384D9EF5
MTTDVNQWQTQLLQQVDRLIAVASQQLRQNQPGPTVKVRGPEYWQRYARHHYVKAAELINEQPFQAAKHFRQAALLGHPKAMLYLGKMFLQGEYLPYSLFHACCWLTLAEKAGESAASQLIKDLSPKLTAREINGARKLSAERFEQLCDASFSFHPSSSD